MEILLLLMKKKNAQSIQSLHLCLLDTIVPVHYALASTRSIHHCVPRLRNKLPGMLSIIIPLIMILKRLWYIFLLNHRWNVKLETKTDFVIEYPSSSESGIRDLVRRE